MFYELLGAAAFLFGAAMLIFFLERQGRKAEQNDQMKRVIDDIHTATAVRDGVRRDADFAKRVRDRFTRKLL